LERVRLKSLAIGGCLSLLAAASSFVPAVAHWEESVGLPLLFRLRGARPPPADVVLIPIDRRAGRSLFLPQSAADFERCRDLRLEHGAPGYRNPDPPDVLTRWPRCLHARVLEALAAAQPEVVVMDVSFRSRSDPGDVFADQDRQLAAAMRSVGRTVLALKIGEDGDAGERAQRIAGDIEAAAIASAPFLLFGERLQHADRYCAFKEDGDWTGPCLPAIALQVTSLSVYPRLRELLRRAAPQDADLLPERADAVLARGSLRPTVRLIRHIAASDRRDGNRIRALLDAESPGAPGSDERLRRLADAYLGAAVPYLNFYGPPGTIDTLRYERLAAGPEELRPAPGSLRGKAVFIGFAETEQAEASEHFATPFTTTHGIKLSGVELAATAYANLLDGSGLVAAARWQRALIALGLGAICTSLFVLAPVPLAASTCALLWAGYLGVAVTFFERSAYWLPLLVPLGIGMPLTAGVGLYREVARQRDRTRRALAALLPGRLVERIVDRNEELSQLRESVTGSCVFTDMQRYTALFRDYSPDEVARILDTYFQALFPVVQRDGGETIDVLGDAMLAVWSDREHPSGSRERACAAALQLVAAAERFRETHAGVGVGTRIGIDYGPMTLGMIGSPLHFEYRPVGEPPNVAARLQELGKHLVAPLLVSEPAVAGLERFVVRDLGTYALRGLPRATHVYALMGERDRATRRGGALCDAFAAALADYRDGRGAQARRGFEGLLRDHPDDGPARFYLALCARGKFYGTTPIPMTDALHVPEREG